MGEATISHGRCQMRPFATQGSIAQQKKGGMGLDFDIYLATKLQKILSRVRQVLHRPV